mmetsp:Transcript_46957/g.106341  ORF Transcript_46957/g.106341 Transcript_46957/m.106341 type:complete len:243 (-) Transcript_46957:1032-1760(-)
MASRALAWWCRSEAPRASTPRNRSSNWAAIFVSISRPACVSASMRAASSTSRALPSSCCTCLSLAAREDRSDSTADSAESCPLACSARAVFLASSTAASNASACLSAAARSASEVAASACRRNSSACARRALSTWASSWCCAISASASAHTLAISFSTSPPNPVAWSCCCSSSSLRASDAASRSSSSLVRASEACSRAAPVESSARRSLYESPRAWSRARSSAATSALASCLRDRSSPLCLA